MFRRIELEPWMQQMPQIALWIFLAIFLLAVVRILLMPKAQLRHLESLPLDQDQERPRYEE